MAKGAHKLARAVLRARGRRIFACAISTALACGLPPAAHAWEIGVPPPQSLNFYGQVGLLDMPSARFSNDGEISGTWTVTCLGDAGSFGGTMKLVREGSTIAGLWSGDLGPDQPVTGTWRDGYVEQWPGKDEGITGTAGARGQLRKSLGVVPPELTDSPSSQKPR